MLNSELLLSKKNKIFIGFKRKLPQDGINFWKKAFYDILVALRDQYNFVYAEDKEAVVVNKPEQTINDEKYVKNKGGYSDSNRYMEIKLVKKIESDKLSLADLKKHGLRGNLQGPCRVPIVLQEYIDSIVK